ncbi:MAG: class I SAM-dependent methyltransferase [Candidatus Omnitrophica bacterium]|nr:class I SAM-dependent methyltransferase [Candidatus Omnitrophota bacterium]
MDALVKKNLIESYQTDGGFIIHDCGMLKKLYDYLGIDPARSLDTRIFELEGITHFFHHGVAALFRKLKITGNDYVLSCGEGSGAPSRLLVKMTGCRVTGIDINPAQLIKARECALLHGIQDKVQYYEQNVEELSLDKKDFTRAYFNETCGHWQDKPKAFARIQAHLNSGAMIGFNVWLKGNKGTLNEAYCLVPEFTSLYKPGIWFQDDLSTYQRLLEESGFQILESCDCTDAIDARMRARLKATLQWDRYAAVMGRKARESALRYYDGMVKTHYDFLKYGVIIAQKNE